MNKLALFILVGLFATSSLQAEKIEGRIIYEHETVNVVFKIPVGLLAMTPNYEKLQFKVKYFDTSGKKHVLRPDDAKEIQFTYRSEPIRMLSVPNTIGAGSLFSMAGKVFLKLEMDGNLKLFNFYYTQSSPGMYNSSTGTMTGGFSYNVDRYILQKDNGPLKRLKGISFRKDMIGYFSDCPALSEKIKNKAFRKSDIKLIVNFYNEKCR